MKVGDIRRSATIVRIKSELIALAACSSNHLKNIAIASRYLICQSRFDGFEISMPGRNGHEMWLISSILNARLFDDIYILPSK